ncbi:MAG: YggS family pyridoxal phosphate-dependent enzyme [Burkholderiales bacterium]|nr:YggS family pyridoxal phosphate-dependent enzyme [Burkholderiales bacterium]OJX02450.1 MAG: YggS family pyridoxal phosphate enzyme [Burkholderiales bacterium 70-64]
MNGNPALRQRYEQVLGRLRQACESAGRAPDSVRLLAVSKAQPASQVLELAALGQRAFGENYLQEALDKIAACRDEWSAAAPGGPLAWHFIGPIQSNKTRPIAAHFDWVHSVEREKIAHRLSEQRPEGLGTLDVCLQVNVSGEASKSGAAPGETLALALAVAALPRLRLRGLMAIPEPTDDVNLQRARFAALRELHARVKAALDGEAARCFDTLSMGMSADLEAAVAEGATIVRIGSALFGERSMRSPLPASPLSSST